MFGSYLGSSIVVWAAFLTLAPFWFGAEALGLNPFLGLVVWIVALAGLFYRHVQNNKAINAAYFNHPHNDAHPGEPFDLARACCKAWDTSPERLAYQHLHRA